jgi:hypothetical protein
MELDWKVSIRSLSGYPRGGDIGVVIPLSDGALAALIDATGHGLTAYAVAQSALRTILNSKNRHPDVLLEELDNDLRGGIGAAVSIARIYENHIQFAGVGNVMGSIDLKPIMIRPGVVGLRMRTPQVVDVQFSRNSWLVMHTDGVARPKNIPNGSAETVAEALLDTYAGDHDDAGILVARWKARI